MCESTSPRVAEPRGEQVAEGSQARTRRQQVDRILTVEMRNRGTIDYVSELTADALNVFERETGEQATHICISVFREF